MAEIRSPGDGGPSALRRRELRAFEGLLEKLDGHGVVLVAGAGEARRVCATGIATAAAVSGRRAALVECDLAAPGLAKALGLAPSPGLHEYLRWEAHAAQILQPLFLAGPETGRVTEPLVCIAGGEATAQGAVLLSSRSFRDAVAKWRSAYDLVVLDGPAADSDAAPLEQVATCADSTVACVERGGPTWRSRRRLVGRLRRLPAEFAGLVACA